MIKEMNKKSEFKHFEKLSNEWWDPEGKFKILHELTPLRVKYIKNMCFDISYKKKSKKRLDNLDILDLGCGGGLLSEPLTRLGANVTGIDFIKQNINIAKIHAKKSNLKIQYLHKNVNKFITKKKFDIILILELLEHLSNWKEIILKAEKFLKPEGKLIISTINRNIFSKFLAIYLAENILKWVPKNTHNYEKLIKPNELISFLENKNLEVIDVTGLIFKPISLEWILKKNKDKINYFCTAIKSN